jgi:hypothetical protein
MFDEGATTGGCNLLGANPTPHDGIDFVDAGNVFHGMPHAIPKITEVHICQLIIIWISTYVLCEKMCMWCIESRRRSSHVHYP